MGLRVPSGANASINWSASFILFAIDVTTPCALLLYIGMPPNLLTIAPKGGAKMVCFPKKLMFSLKEKTTNKPIKKSQFDVCGATAKMAFFWLISSPSTRQPLFVSTQAANDDNQLGHLRGTCSPTLTLLARWEWVWGCEVSVIIILLCLLHLGYLFANLFSEASKWNAVTKSALLSILYPHIN